LQNAKRKGEIKMGGTEKMVKIMKRTMIALMAAMMVFLMASCGGGGGGGTTVAAAADTGSADGYVYTEVEGDAARTSARALDRPAGYIPLAGATVSAEGRTATTNEQGYFKISGLAPGPRTLQITRTGFNPIQRLITIIRNQNVTAIP
jgi:hypothetical protein